PANDPQLAQTRARIHPEIDAAADRVPFGGERDRLADGVQVAPALGQAALALERGAAAVPVYEVHRLAGAVGGVGRGQPAAGPLFEGGLLAGGGRRPELGDLRAAIGAPGIEDRVGPPNRILHLPTFAQQTGGPAAWLLAPGQIDQRVEAGPRDTGDDSTMVRPDPALNRQ